ncbi:MAG: nucleoside hydrolase [Pseudomonadota bacterium]
MTYARLVTGILLFSLILAACISPQGPGDTPLAVDKPQIIFDTDFGGDADDLGAVAMLHYYADRGDIDLLAIISWSNESYALPALAAVNQFYGRPDLPLGVREVASWRTDWNYNKAIADQFPHAPEAVTNASPAVALYRRLLANAAPNSITIVTVGPLANIQNLLNSGPDAISDASGTELVAAKVDQFVIMGGQFPQGITAHGPEWNFDGNMPGVTQAVLETITRPVVFSGYEVGEALKYGAELNQHPNDTPLYVGYKYFSEHAPWMKQDYQGQILDNSSFDQTAVMYAAINGVDEFWTLSAPGTLNVDARGVGTWNESNDGRHRYLILKDDVETTISEIAAAMTH